MKEFTWDNIVAFFERADVDATAMTMDRDMLVVDGAIRKRDVERFVADAPITKPGKK